MLHVAAPILVMDAAASDMRDAFSLNSVKSQLEQGSSPTATASSGLTFSDLPLEIREIIWRFALPDSRVFNTLVWVSAGLKMQLLNRSELKMPLAHACFEARRVVRESGYVLAFRDEDEAGDTGVWFHPRRDRIERTIWGPGDWNAGA
ncbi:hypothetical protein F5B22DRAFT_606801 [Xylaria bambusicola]|uniref:uncharacterized protein n=1 Tax=Xylaria bambusicola TaxID=326684 RepID=UPI002007E9B0|nr:uncharacterized protein F5B22DRAFT_606801 [Xylaria bambusicola]KAI0516861.1 hypothetical protein F5B22DRAFT_606801 [Xylaria bambusicola]